MKFAQLLAAKAADIFAAKEPVMAFLGDSVTQGCFEVYEVSDTAVETVYESKNAYAEKLSRIFSVLYPNVPVGVINAGISGGTAPNGLERLERDVLCHHPDLITVCFGLNDCGHGPEGLQAYLDALQGIFRACREAGAEVLFLTPNIMATRTDPRVGGELCRKIAQSIAQAQNGGVLDLYIQEAKALCAREQVPVCDAYARWKRLQELGADTTGLLANYLNHPTREMHWLFAAALADTILFS